MLVRRSVLVVSVGVAVAGGAVAGAAIPGADGVITACVQQATAGGGSPGAVRIVDAEAGQPCTGNETRITWNQQGPTGPQGPQGIQGQPGSDAAAVRGFYRTYLGREAQGGAAAPKQILTLQLPEGRWLLRVGGTATRPAAGITKAGSGILQFRSARCQLQSGGVTIGTIVGESEAILLPAVQKVREAAARAKRRDAFDLAIEVEVPAGGQTATLSCGHTARLPSGARPVFGDLDAHLAPVTKIGAGTPILTSNAP